MCLSSLPGRWKSKRFVSVRLLMSFVKAERVNHPLHFEQPDRSPRGVGID